jgi:Fe-S-cluster containining protein
MTWYADGLQFECKACGRCCGGGAGYVWVTQNDIDAMAKCLGLSPLLFEQAFVWTVRGRQRSLKEYQNGDCVMLDEKSRGCKVYDQRPVQCRTWPFWKQNIDIPASWKVTAKFCPGCNRGKLFSAEEITERSELF